MKTVFAYLAGGGFVFILGIFAYGAVRLNMDRGNTGFPATRRRGRK